MKQRKAKGEDAENTKTTDTPNRELSKQRESHVQNYATAMECAWGITSSFK